MQIINLASAHIQENLYYILQVCQAEKQDQALGVSNSLNSYQQNIALFHL